MSTFLNDFLAGPGSFHSQTRGLRPEKSVLPVLLLLFFSILKHLLGLTGNFKSQRVENVLFNPRRDQVMPHSTTQRGAIERHEQPQVIKNRFLRDIEAEERDMVVWMTWPLWAGRGSDGAFLFAVFTDRIFITLGMAPSHTPAHRHLSTGIRRPRQARWEGGTIDLGRRTSASGRTFWASTSTPAP